MSITGYLDTCIVSGIAKSDLLSIDRQALLVLLQAGKQGTIRLVTSAVTQREIERVPPEHRAGHEVIYNLLADVPLARTHTTDPGMLLLGVGGGQRKDRLLRRLEEILPDREDAEHVFQAAKNGVQYFVTADRRTILTYRADVETACNVKPVSPHDLVSILGLQPP